MENLNEVLPKYKVTRNGTEVSMSMNRINIMSDYSYIVKDSAEFDRIEVLEDTKVIATTIVQGDAK